MKSIVAAIAATLLLAIPGSTQSAADLLQKGIYAQETAGDLNGAIQIFRQVANPASGNKAIAAQAQYQLVLCMLQRGDRAGASKEAETLARNFPDQQDLISKARKLLPGGSATLPAPWGEGECSQLNIKRDGVATGEFLFYSIDPKDVGSPLTPKPDVQSIRWELTTKNSLRSALALFDRTAGRTVGPLTLKSNDNLGDPAVEPLAGPAIDIQQSVFAMRRLPLAVGYKTTLTTLPLTLLRLVPREVELSVTGIEPVKVTAGEFKCYKVSFSSLGQTFWFGVEGARQLVKFKSGNTEAELVKVWGPENFIETELGAFRDAGWEFSIPWRGPGPEWRGTMGQKRIPTPFGMLDTLELSVTATKIYSPASEIPQALLESLPKSGNKCQAETVQKRVIGGQQAVSCVTDDGYRVWIRSESASLELFGSSGQGAPAIIRWQIDRILATGKRIP